MKTLHEQESGRLYRGRCLYKTGKCPYERAMKRDKTIHKLCELHRAKANDSQRKLDHKKKEMKIIRRNAATKRLSEEYRNDDLKRLKMMEGPTQDSNRTLPMDDNTMFEPLCEADMDILVACLMENDQEEDHGAYEDTAPDEFLDSISSGLDDVFFDLIDPFHIDQSELSFL